MAGHQYEGITVANSSNTWLGDTHVDSYYAGEPDDTRCLKVAKGAVFDDRENDRDPLCHPKTRKRLLRQISKWADDPEGKCIFWLRGAAGTGKSTISRTVAKSFSNEGKLAASFFFNRTIDDCNKADLFVTTIAHQLIHNVHKQQNIQGLKELIRNVIHNNPDLPNKGLKMQFDKLILGPLKELGSVGSSKTTLLLVIDALDECDIEDYTGAGPYLERTRMIVRLLGEFASVTRIRVRVFITSRPELSIQLGFKHDVPESFHQDVALHEISPSEIEHDIRAYLEHELKRMQALYEIPPPWPDSNTTTLLVRKCSPLFIYAATICRFMDNRRLNPRTQLKKILDLRYKSANKMEMTYGPVLDQLVSGLDECDLEDVIDQFRKIVGSIILLADPLPVFSLSQLLDDSEDEVFQHLKNLRSVLSVPGDPKSDEIIQVFHLSFPEYLLDRNGERSQFLIDEQQKHTDLLNCCLRVMSNRSQHCLKNDICRLKDPGILRQEVAAEKVRESIPRHLKYACMYWVHHLEKTDCLTNETIVYEFLTKQFVYWLEAMSWLGRIEQCANEIRKLHTIFRTPGSKFALFLEDAGRFVAEHKYTIDRAPCQVYVSALLFSPNNSIVKQTFRSEIPKWVIRAPEIATTWDAVQRSLHQYRSRVRGMCYSRDGVYLAIAIENEVNIWNIRSHTLCATKNDFETEVSCIAFRSANNIAVGLTSGSIVLWGWTHSQQSIENLSDSCVAYMSSSENGDLVCGFSNREVYLWKQNLGILYRWKTCWPPIYDVCSDISVFGNPQVTGISYSVDGRFVAILRDGFPGHVDVYDANSGCYVHGVRTPEGKSFRSLALLPKSLLLVIYGPSNHWDSDEGETAADQVQFWDLITNTEAPIEETPFNSPSHLRPDMNQSRILCLHGSSEQLDIWDLRKTPVLIRSFTTMNLSCFSPDGRYIAAASSGHVTIIDTLHILPHNTNTDGFQLSRDYNERLLWPQATWSPDGSRLGMITSHGRVIVWDFIKGQIVPCRLDALLKRSYSKLALSWSTDGATLVAAMPDELSVYHFLSEHETTKDIYSLELASYSLRSRRYLCCSSRGSFLAMINHVHRGQCEIVMWKWEGRALRHLWTRHVGPESSVATPHSLLAFSPDEVWLACSTLGQYHSLMLINVEFGNVAWKAEIDKSWHPLIIAFDSIGSRIVVGARDACQNETDSETDSEMDDEVDEEVDDEVDDTTISEGDEGDDDERPRASHVFVFSIHEGRLLHSEPIVGWGMEHAKFFAVGFIVAAPIVVRLQDWLRLKHMAQQDGTPAAADSVSCHMRACIVDEDHWIMKGDQRKVLLLEDLQYGAGVNDSSTLLHRFFGYNASTRKPWLIDLDCTLEVNHLAMGVDK